MTNTPALSIGAPGFDAERLVADLQATVDRKMADGVYADARVAHAERTNLVHLRASDDFIAFYLTCLREAVFVDISDYEIHERRRFLGPLLVAFKKTIWNLLKFYTYRLWSQQNQVNGLVVTALEGMEEQTAVKLASLEKRIAELEAKTVSHGS